MAKVTITLTDTNDEGGVNVAVDFDPPVDTSDDDVTATPAQNAAIEMLEVLQAHRVGDLNVEGDYEDEED